ncbi:MAG: choice-of-anchor J domain-containing protein [Bacteroidales bacterium]|nr:choice-of-anchor J domain-containing protein [Bacteroidales bacterium]
MKKVHNLLHLWMLMVFFLPGLIINAQDLMITGIGDGPLTGGEPKVLELYVVNDIPDLSAYTIKNQTNANTSWTGAYTLSGSATAGDFIYVTIVDGTPNFNAFFENTLTPLENGVINLNGDDRVAIFDALDNIVDIFGEDGVDGSTTAWDYLDGWAYRNNFTSPTSTFDVADWSFSGINQLEGGTTNATCTSPMPIGTFVKNLATISATGDDFTLTWNAPIGTYDAGIIINGAPFNTDGGFFLLQLRDESDNLVVFSDVFDEFSIGLMEYHSGTSLRNLADFTATQQSGIWGTASVSDNAAAGGSLRGTTLDGSLFYGVMVDGTVGTVGAVLPATGSNTETISYTASASATGTYTLYIDFYAPFRPGDVATPGFYTIAELEGLTPIASISKEIVLGGGALAFPFYEPFETWPLDNWTIIGDDAEVWESNDGNSYGPGNVVEGTLAAMFDVYNASSGNTTTMTTDVIDASSAVSPILYFQYWMDGSADSDLWIKAEMTTDGSTWTEVFYQEQDGTISDWTEVSVPLVGTNSTTQIRLTGSSDWGSYNLFVDDLQVKEQPTNTMDWCNLQWPDAHTMLSSETVTVYARGYEAGITDAVGQGANVECWIGYSDTDTDPSTWTSWVAATYNTDDGNNDEYQADLGPLAAGTYYYASRWMVEDGPYTYGGYNVGGGNFWDGTTNVSGVLTVNDPVITYINLPISEDFEAGLGNVIFVNGTQTNYWMNGPLATQTGDCMYVTNDGTANAYSVSSTSVSHAYIPIDFAGITNANLSFDWISDGENNYDFLKVYLVPESTVITDGVQLDAADQIGTVYQDGTAVQTPVITLSATEITQDQMKLVFSWRNDASDGTQPPASVDNILLEEITCMEPSTIAASNITATSADITWTASVLGETSWNIKVNATNTIDPTSVDGDVVANDVVTTTPEYALSTLTAETDYYVYVQSACGSDWVEYMFTTLAACPVPTTLNAAVVSDDVTLTWDELGQTDWNIKIHPSALTNPDTETADIEDAITGGTGEYILNDLSIGTYYWYVQSDCGSAWADGQFYIGYCLPAPSSVDNSGITNVRFGQNVIVNNPTGTETNNYGDYSSIVGDGAQGIELTVDITYSTGYTYGTKIWVDWNNDLEFSDVDELMYTGLSSATNPTTLNASFIVPIATPLGQYRMRIGGTDNDDGPSNACYTGAYGSFEDYTLEVVTPPACLQPTALFEDNITSTGATLNWTDNGESLWNLVAATAPFNPTSSTGDFGVIPITTNPFTIPDGTLTPNTTYYWYIQADCGGDVSAWSAEGEFTTLCDAVEFFEEDFDGVSTPNLPDCWSSYVSPSYSFQTVTTITGTPNSTPNYISLYSSGATVATDAPILVSPIISNLNSGTKILSLSAKGNSSNTSIVIGTMSDPNDSNTFTEIETITGLSTSAWNDYNVSFETYVGTDQHIALRHPLSTTYAYVYVDDIILREVSDENDILTFALAEQTGPATIGAGTIDIEVAMGTDPNGLVPTFTISDYATVDFASGDPQDFSSAFNYTVTSESGIDQIWSVTVTVATTLSAQKDIETFELYEEVAPATIGANTVDITVNFMADVTNLTPTITISDLATISPESGEVQDFSSPVTYTVTAEDATTKDYIVTVTKESSPLGADCTNPYLVSLPADLTYEHLGQTTCGMGDVYNDLDIPDGAYDNGEDVIYEIEVTADSYVRMTLDPKTTTYTAIAIFDDCPDSGTILNGEYGYAAGLKTFDIALTTGTYYVAIDMATYNDDCIPEYDFTIEEICPEVTDIEEVNLTATSADIEWVETGFSTAWNIKVNEATAIADPTTTDGDIIANDAVTTTPLYSITSGTLTAETDYYVYVQSDCGSEWVEYMFTTPAACPVPTGLMATVLGANDVDLAWNELGTTDWVLEVSTTPLTDPSTESGDILDDESVIGATGEYSLTGLDANTTYYWYVQSACGSAWSAQGEFTTECDAFTAPYTESFDAYGTGSAAFPDCWARPITYGTSPIYPSCVTAYSVSSPASLRFQSLVSTPTYAITPALTNDINTLMVTFNLKAESTTNSGTIEVGVMSDPYDLGTFELVETITPTSTNWTEYEIYFNTTTLSGANNYVAFRHNTNNEYWYYWLDDVVIDLIPSCPKPIDLFADNITTTSANLNWTEAGTADTWNIKVNKDVAIDPTTEDGNILANESTMDNPYIDLTTLEPATTYYFYVQADCGAGDESEWSTAGMFTTECEIYTIPHFEGFEDGDMPTCWTILNEDGDLNEWGIGNGDGDPYEGAQTASISFNSSGNDDWLISPQFNISNINTVVDFYAMSRSSTFPEDFNVLISTTGNSTSDFTIVLENIIDHPDTWELHSYLLSDYGIIEGQNIYVAIQSISVDEWNLYIDAFSIHELPQIADIDINSDAVDVEVCQGTIEADAIAALATQITITDTDAAEYLVDLTWTIASYDANTPADYTATGTFALPVGVVQTDPVTPLEVTALVTVNAPVEPTFSFATEYCLNSTADALPTISDNGIEGAWAPATIATDAAGSADYIFTPLTGECGTGTTISVTINDLPVVTCPETVNVAVDEPVTFTGQDPVGGTFSGTGVVGDTFDPNGLANDTYVITYTYTDPVTGCENSCDFDVIVDIDINVADVTVEGIGIYPNPNNGEFVINFNNIEGNVTYQLYDTKGSIIILKDLSANGNTVEEISVDLVPGVYYVKVVTANQTYVEKLVVE